MFTLLLAVDLRRGGPGRPEGHRDLADSLVRSAGLVYFRPPSTSRELVEEVRRTEVPERVAAQHEGKVPQQRRLGILELGSALSLDTAYRAGLC
jgi:hypothetical protein